jgi:hypothetical protein
MENRFFVEAKSFIFSVVEGLFDLRVAEKKRGFIGAKKRRGFSRAEKRRGFSGWV